MLSNSDYETDIEGEVGTGRNVFWSRKMSRSGSQQASHSTGATDDTLMNGLLMNLGGRLRRHPWAQESPSGHYYSWF